MSLEISNKGDNLNNPDILIQSDYKFLELTTSSES